MHVDWKLGPVRHRHVTLYFTRLLARLNPTLGNHRRCPSIPDTRLPLRCSSQETIVLVWVVQDVMLVDQTVKTFHGTGQLYGIMLRNYGTKGTSSIHDDRLQKARHVAKIALQAMVVPHSTLRLPHRPIDKHDECEILRRYTPVAQHMSR